MIFDSKTKEKEIIKMCRFCFMCRHACPVFLATKKDSNTPRGHALLISMVDEGISDWTDDMVNRMYECSQCHLCRELCEFHWEEDVLIQKIREKIVEGGKAPGEVTDLAAKIIENGSIHESQQIFLGDRKVINNNEDIDLLYFAGPNILYEDTGIVEKTGKILDMTGIKWGMLENETYTGVELFELGFKNEAEKAAKILVKMITKFKPRILVTGDPHILRAFKKLYPEWDIEDLKDIEIYHISEYLYKLVKEGRIKIQENIDYQKVAYHDPCNLGREMEIYDEPRELIKAVTGSYPIELFHNKGEAECCGSGSVMHITNPDVSKKVAKKRMDSVLEENAKIIVTACPNCKRMLNNTANDNNDLEVIDIIELISLHEANDNDIFSN